VKASCTSRRPRFSGRLQGLGRRARIEFLVHVWLELAGQMAYLLGRMPSPRSAVYAARLALGLALVLACSGRREEGTREKVFTARGTGKLSPALELGRPLEALRVSGDDVAARAGSFAWEAKVAWNVAKPGVTPVRAVERHRIRQLATGEFEVSTDLDPGAGPGSETGKQIVFATGTTYARGRWAPFRERPTDRGRDARRFRDESFRIAADLADLYGQALSAQLVGETTFLGRRAQRYVLSLSGAAPREAPAPPGLPDGGYDPDTKRRVDFLQGRVPVALEGELLLDAETALPLSVTMKGAFSEKSDPQLRAEVELAAQVKALGARVPGVAPPRDALADDRKPMGVARALEAAGFRKLTGGQEREEAEDEGEAAAP